MCHFVVLTLCVVRFSICCFVLRVHLLRVCLFDSVYSNGCCGLQLCVADVLVVCFPVVL